MNICFLGNPLLLEREGEIYSLCIFKICFVPPSHSVCSVGPKMWLSGHHLELGGFLSSDTDLDDALSFVKGDVSSKELQCGLRENSKLFKAVFPV